MNFCKDDNNSITFAIRNRGVEQLVARWAHNPKVTGSSPVPATKKKADSDESAFLLPFILNGILLLHTALREV